MDSFALCSLYYLSPYSIISHQLLIWLYVSYSSSDRTDLDEELTRAIALMCGICLFSSFNKCPSPVPRSITLFTSFGIRSNNIARLQDRQLWKWRSCNILR